MNTSKDIALTIKKLFEESGYSTLAFCNKCGIRTTTFNNMIKGDNVPQLEKVITVLDVLGYELNIVEVDDE